MALECLLISEIEQGKEIALHPEATYVWCKSGKLRQFKVNPCPHEGMIQIPKMANTIRFDRYNQGRSYIDYGEPVFSRTIRGRRYEYDSERNILNMQEIK